MSARPRRPADFLEVVNHGLYIGGDWRPSSDSATIEVRDPATGEPFATVASASKDDVTAAVDSAADAAESWANTPPRERGEILRRTFELLTELEDEYAALIVKEMGKTLAESQGEMRYGTEFFRWFSEEAVRNDGSVTIAPAGDKRIIAIGQPIGISVLITPWNFPAAMATRKIAPALAAGCPVILKPASDTPLTALALAATMEEAGIPPGVMNVVPSNRSSEVVPRLLEDQRVRKLSFTGSTAVGRQLLIGAATNVVSCSMELGGDAPFLVFEDADIPDAVDGAMVAKLRNGGQSCIAANRFLVHSAVAEEFARQLSEAMGTITLGPGMQPGVGLGPLINAAAQEEMLEIVDVAAGAGASVRVGGNAPDRPGYYFEPTLLSDVFADSPILGREIFGPMAPIITFESEEEAIELANDTVHGLASYLYTTDLARGLRVAEAIESGMVGINRGMISDPAAPFGGVKQSGLGREGSHEGMKEFLETKYIAASW